MMAGSLLTDLVVAQTADPDLLFIIERSRDMDEVWYSLNTVKNGNLDERMPINVFWVRKSTNNKKDPLTIIQKKL